MPETKISEKELSKAYSPAQVEDKWYPIWEKAGAYEPDENSSDSYTLMIPPPNVTGILTMGHVLNNTIQDVLVRRARMQGKSTLWLPGTDHASIATEAKVTSMLKDDGISKREIGREEFLIHAWKWKEKYGDIIIQQLKKLGASCDWNREKFTMDEDYSRAVQEVFVRLYNDGLIYRGERIINWDPKGQTALSEEEVIYKDIKGHLWHFRYPLNDVSGHLVVATTRPETMLGDTGVAVNPKDKRYSDLVGKSVLLPIVNREIPIFADSYVDMEFGTGCVKVTPAHDPNDYHMAKRNDLELLNIMNDDASFNKNVPEIYQGKDRFEVRKMILENLEKQNYLLKTEEYIHKVGYSERTDVVVEPRLSKQWFLKMIDLAKPALEVVKNNQIKFHPNRWEKIYNHWLNNIQDWCISRQLWWGHRIPVWYKGNEVYCDITPPSGDGWVQEEDILDNQVLDNAISQINECNESHTICIIKKDSFDKVELKFEHQLNLSKYTPRSEFFISLNRIFKQQNILFIGTTGNTSREMYKFMRDTDNLYMAGNMGGALSVGFGAAKAGKKVIVCGGDAEFVMHMGALTNLGRDAKNINLTYIVFDNESNKSTGGQNSYQQHIDYIGMAKSSNILNTFDVTNIKSFNNILEKIDIGVNFIYIKCSYDIVTPRPPLDVLIRNSF